MANVPAALKAFVITTGVILLIGMIILAVMIMLKAGADDSPEETSLPKPAVDLAMPSGAKINQVVVDGKRLVLLAEDSDGQQYLAVVDALSGARQSLIRITPTE